jgi:hypothetical protein
VNDNDRLDQLLHELANSLAAHHVDAEIARDRLAKGRQEAHRCPDMCRSRLADIPELPYSRSSDADRRRH